MMLMLMQCKCKSASLTPRVLQCPLPEPMYAWFTVSQRGKREMDAIHHGPCLRSMDLDYAVHRGPPRWTQTRGRSLVGT